MVLLLRCSSLLKDLYKTGYNDSKSIMQKGSSIVTMDKKKVKFPMRIQKEHIPDYIGMGMFILAILFLIRCITLCTGRDIWYDELFTMEFASRPVSELIKLTAADVHPPLYYIIVKAAILAGTQIAPGVDPIAIAKITSVIPFLLLMLVSFISVRKNFGWLSAGIFSFCIVCMPQMPDYIVEVRMYGWAMLFVTAAALHAYEIMKSCIRPSRRWNLADSAGILIWGIAACYTHYYACIAIACLYLLLLIWMIRQMFSVNQMQEGQKAEKDFRGLAAIFICMNLTAAAFIPWIGAVLAQVSTVKSGYWIQPLTWRTLGGCVKFLFKPAFGNSVIATGMAVILFLLFAATVLYGLKKMHQVNDLEEKTKLQFAGICILIMAGLVAAGFIASALIRPVFVYRYMLPASGVLWLSFAVYAGDAVKHEASDSEKENQKYRFCLLILLWIVLITGIRDFSSFKGNELYKKIQMQHTQTVLSEIQPGTEIICNFGQLQALAAYMLGTDSGCEIVLYGAEPEALIQKILPNVQTITSPEQITTWLSEGDKVLFFGSFLARDEIMKDWQEQYGIHAVDTDSCMLERYWFDIYELSADVH